MFCLPGELFQEHGRNAEGMAAYTCRRGHDSCHSKDGKTGQAPLLLLLPAILLISLLLSGSGTAGDIIGLDASWQVTERGMDSEEENSSSYNQRYHLQWNPRITRALSMDTDMNYSRYWTTGRGTREIISPALNLLLQNDLFLMQFNGYVTETRNSDRRDLSDHTWEALLKSNWDTLYRPSLSMIVGRNQLGDSEEVPLTDSEREWYEFIAQWERERLQTYYSYYSQVLTDYVEGTEYDEGRHFGRIDYSRFFLDRRGQFSISEQITDSTTDFTAVAGEGETVNIAVSLSQGLAGIDPTPEQGSLPGNPALIDGNRNTTAFVIELQQTANLGIKTDLQRVDVLHVYTGELDPLFVDDTSGLRWDLYTSRDNIDWRRTRVNVPTTYNRDEFRYEVDVSGTEDIYLKLVVTGWPVTISIPVAEIQAFRRQSGEDGRIDETQGFTKYLTDFNVRYAPTVDTRASYSLVWENYEHTPGNDRDRLFQSGSFQWLHSIYFVPTLIVNQTKTDNSETTDSLYRSYGLSIRSTPLPTLDTTLSFTRNESYEDDEAFSRNHTINLLTSAILYPNLESTLDINVIFNENDIVDRSSEAYGIRWTLTGRLRPDLLADLITEYGSNTQDLAEAGREEDTGGRTTVNINYRPSDRLSFLLNASQGYGEKWENYQTFIFDTNLSILRTAKTHVILGYRINAFQEDTVNNFNCRWSWSISEYLTLQSFANYLITEEDNIWAVNARLSARF
ncbi:MAG: hypothetical protein SCH71_06240 [Desulfobulbaceae bacterium]|nr:hypothetical protein [Desulfobulbaceae bacterium]